MKAGNIASTLLSLRKFVDMGLCIYLDNEIIRVYDMKNKDFIVREYIEPNWIISFQTINSIVKKKDHINAQLELWN